MRSDAKKYDRVYETNEFLVNLIKELDWSYKRFALETGVCQHQVSKWCMHAVEMRFSTLKDVMGRLKVELKIIANYEEEE